MRKITMLILLLTTLVGFSQNAPIDFEAGGQGASWTWTVFENDDNPPLAIVANPDPTGANTSATVAEFTARGLGAPFAGVESMHGGGIGTFDLTAANAFVTIKVYKTKISNVGIKLVTPSGGAQPELLVSNTQVNQWETLVFDFTSYIGLPETTGLDQIVIFPDFINRAADDIIYFDEITFSNMPPPQPIAFPVDFEQPVGNYSFVGFEGADSAIEANAVSGGINTSATVMRSTKTVGAQFFAGTALELDTPIDFSSTEMITVKTYSPKMNIPVKMRLENSDNSVGIEVDVNTTVMDEWETLTYDFTGQTAGTDFVRVVMFFEFVPGLAGDGSTYYYDDIELLQAPPIGLPVDFEQPVGDYSFVGFEGADSAIEANAVSGGINTSATVMRSTKTVGAQFFAGTALELDTPIDFSSTEMITVKTYSPKMNIPVKMRLENSDNSVGIEVDVNTTVMDEWETLTYDFTGQTAGTDFVRVVMFFEFVPGLAGDGSTYYYDDIELLQAPPIGLPVDFEQPVGDYSFVGFEGADSAIEANAVSGGINTSATVMRSTKTVGAQFFAGTALELDTPIDFSSTEMITVKTYSPKMNIPVKMRLENSDNSVGIEVDVNTTVMDEWETLTYDFTGQTAGTDFVRVVMFFEFVPGLAGDGSTYYYDDIELFTPPSTPVELPVTFEDATANYVFLGFEGADSAIEANAVSGGINTSATVMRSTKTVGAQFFAGTLLDLDVPIDFSGTQSITMKTYSPKVDIPVRMALENQVTGDQIFVDVNTTVADEWETLTYDFSGVIDPAISYDRVVVFFEFIDGLAGDGSTYYYDDIELFTPPSTPVELPVTFEDATANYVFLGFEGADSAIEANAVSGGINTSATVMRSTKTVGAQFFAGTLLDLDVPIDFSGTQTITMKTYSPKVDIPVRMALENQVTGDQIFVDVNTTVADEWETLTYDFSGVIDPAISYDRVVVFFEFIDGLAGDGSTYYYDDIELFTPPSTPVELPVTFEDATANYVFLGFEGADSAIEANAVSGGINTSATVMRSTKTVGAQFFAGTLLDLDVPIDFSGTQSITMKTYSPKVDIPVRMALENQVTGDQIFVDVNTTVADEWETLTYDFSGVIDPAISYDRVVVFFEFIDGLAGDGSTYYYDDIMIAEPLGTSDFESTAAVVYPNPANNVITIQSETEISQIRIISTTGQTVLMELPNQMRTQVNVESLASGIYFVEITGETGGTDTIRIIKR